MTPTTGRETRQMLKLQRYDGMDSLDTFLRKFQSMAKCLQWSEEDAMYHLCGSLDGAAGQILLDIVPSATTADVKLLQTRFGTEGSKRSCEHDSVVKEKRSSTSTET